MRYILIGLLLLTGATATVTPNFIVDGQPVSIETGFGRALAAVPGTAWDIYWEDITALDDCNDFWGSDQFLLRPCGAMDFSMLVRTLSTGWS